jgi:hypothetical protein
MKWRTTNEIQLAQARIRDGLFKKLMNAGTAAYIAESGLKNLVKRSF